MSIADTWQSGATNFVTMSHNDNKFAVVAGKTFEDLKYVFKVKIADCKPYFINMASKAKSWELPDCYPNDRSASADQGNVSSTPRGQQALAAQKPSAEAVAENKNNNNNNNNTSTSSALQQQQQQQQQLPKLDVADRAEIIDRVRAMYLKYNPTKLSDLDKIIGSFEGKFDQLFPSLVSRYGPEPSETERRMLLENAITSGGDANIASPLTAADAASSPGPPKRNNAENNNNNNNNNNDSSASPFSDRTPSNNTAVKPSSPSSEWTFSDRVYAIYNKYAPEKAKHAEKQLRNNAGHEELLINALVSKYGPEPPRPTTPTISASPLNNNNRHNSDFSGAGSPYSNNNNNYNVDQQAGSNVDDSSFGSPVLTLKHYSQQHEHDQDDQQVQQQQQRQVSAFANANNNSNKNNNYSPTNTRQTATSATETDPSPLPHPRAPVVTIDLPQMAPQTPSPIFDTQKLLQAPASVRQELLMSFLQDRDARLKEALDRNDRYSQVIQQLQDGHDALARECENVKRRSQQEQDMLRSQLRDAQHSMEMTKGKWSEERDRSSNQQEIDKLEAKRNIHTQLIALEEQKIQYGKEISDLKSKLAISSHASKTVREEATALLSVLARKEERLRGQQDELNSLTLKLQGPAKVSAGSQTQESLSDIIRSVAKHMSAANLGGGAAGAAGADGGLRSASTEAESFKNISARLAQANADRSAPLPVAELNSCKRCRRAPGVLACPSCRLTLCYICDQTVHNANVRFRAHPRVLVAIDGRQGAANPYQQQNQNQNQQQHQRGDGSGSNSPFRSESLQQQQHIDATLGLLPGDIEEQLASGIDGEVFDRVIAQFDAAFEAKRTSKTEEVDRLRAHVRDLEEAIAGARKENGGNNNNNNNNNSSNSFGSPKSRSIGGGGNNNNLISAAELNQVHLHIESEQRRNAELCSRIQELEAMLLASPEHKEFEETGRSPNNGVSVAAFGPEEKKVLELHISQLQRELDSAKIEIKEKKREIADMRGLLSTHMSSPSASAAKRRASANGGMTPESERAKPMRF